VNRWFLAAVALGLPPFLYVAAAGMRHLPGAAIGVSLAAFLVALGLATYPLVEPVHGPRFGALGLLALLVVLMVVSIDPVGAGLVLDAVGWGALLAGPALLFLTFVAPNEGAGTRVVGLQFALALGLLLLAAVAAGSAGQPGLLVRNTFAALDAQLVGVAHLLVGRSAASLPLAGVGDPWFAGLAGLAVLATFVTFLRPVTGRGIVLPTAGAERPGPAIDPAIARRLTPRFRGLFESRSSAVGPPMGRLPGLAALLGAAAAGAGVLIADAGLPAAFLLALAIAVVASVGAVVVVERRPLD